MFAGTTSSGLRCRSDGSEIAANVVDLDDAAAVAFMITDNRSSDLGSYNDDLLAAIIAEQAAADNLGAQEQWVRGRSVEDPEEADRLVAHMGALEEGKGGARRRRRPGSVSLRTIRSAMPRRRPTGTEWRASSR